MHVSSHLALEVEAPDTCSPDYVVKLAQEKAELKDASAVLRKKIKREVSSSMIEEKNTQTYCQTLFRLEKGPKKTRTQMRVMMLIRNHLQPFRTFKAFGTIWNLWNHLEPFGTTWNHVEPFGTI